MRLLNALGVVCLFCCGAARALSIDGDPQLHSAVGQPLAVAVPISLSGDEVSRVYYRLTPGAGLAEAEERAAASVHAGYDPNGPSIVLSTAERVTVPAIRVRLEIGAGSVVVSRDLTVLFDLPDLNNSAPLDASAHALRPTNDAHAELSTEAAPEGARGIGIRKEEQQGAPVAFGDAASRRTAASAQAQAPVPTAAPQMVIAPRPRYFNSYQVKRGDTLASIAEHLARAGAGNAEAVMLAVYEANVEAFPPGDPQHPIAGRQLDIPDAASIGTEPRYRINEFRDYLRKPVGEWQVPVTLMRKAAAAAEEAAPTVPWWSRNSHLLFGLAGLALLLLGLRRLFRRSEYARAAAAARRLSNNVSSAPPAVLSNLLQAQSPAPREPAPSLLLAAPQPQETEQAEIARLRELLDQQPTRADLRLRLAQRLYEARRAVGFAEVALPLQQVLNPEPWEKVRAMGHELLPLDYRFQPQHASASPGLEAFEEPEQKAAAQPASSAIDFDFHGEMARVDKARRDVFGNGTGGQPA
jgi:hypothetical protein